MQSHQVLVLNRSFLPIHFTSVRRALTLLYSGLAKAVDHQYQLFDFKSWSELSVLSHEERVGLVNGAMKIPRVILLHFYDKVPKRDVRFSRINIFLRDQHMCQYCRRIFGKSDLNLDHVIPLSLGGKTSWENVVCSCISCNLKKGGRIPEKAGMTLFKKPVKPDWSFFFHILTRKNFHEAWKPFLNLVDYSYWNVELKSEL